MSEREGKAAEFDLAVVGGGFSGVMVALHAARAQQSPIRIAIVERAAAAGRGTAYAEAPAQAILNVAAGAMSAFPDRPDDFVRWLGDADPAAFLPRHLYGRYLQALLAQAQADGLTITCVRCDVADVRRRTSGFALVDAGGQTVATAALVVLALGAPPPADLLPGITAARAHHAYVADPWAFLRAPAFPADGDILIAGSGLTALDVIAEFARTGARNVLHVVSRGGRFPLPHAIGPAASPIAPFAPDQRPQTMREIVGQVRAAVREAAVRGVDWRRVMDGLRPQIAGLWSGLDLAERRRFLRHVRPVFDPHRHRAPAALLAQKDALATSGQLHLSAARIVALRPDGGALEVRLAPRGGGDQRVIRAAAVINCGGPAHDYSRGTGTLVERLLERGDICCDPTGLGLRSLADGRLIDAHGRPSSDLFTIGWPMRGALLETTAVRELRDHARDLGRLLAGLLASRTASIH